MGWNLAPSPSTAISRRPWCLAFQRSLRVAAVLGSMRWSEVSTPEGIALSPKNLAAYCSAASPSPTACLAWPMGDSPVTLRPW